MGVQFAQCLQNNFLSVGWLKWQSTEEEARMAEGRVQWAVARHVVGTGHTATQPGSKAEPRILEVMVMA